jgi:beta-carotene hydroxylase
MRIGPTVVLGVSLIIGFFGLMTLGCCRVSTPTLLLLAGFQLLAIVALYTVAHDAVHRIASPSRLLNEIMLVGCGVVFLFDPWIYRRLHLVHHAHAHSNQDPDRFASSSWLGGRLARSAVLQVGYYLHAFRTLWPHRRWRAHLILSPLLPVVAAALFASVGQLGVFLALWLIPLAVAGWFLGFVLSSLPHDHEADRTRNLKLPRPLCWLLGNGHLHLAHHEFPRVQWYRLPRVWREHQQALR